MTRIEILKRAIELKKQAILIFKEQETFKIKLLQSEIKRLEDEQI